MTRHISSSWGARLLTGATCLALWGCGPTEPDAEDDSPAPDEGWECSAAREGQEKCDGDSVIWCHAVSHGDLAGAHFHEGARCGDKKMTCVEAVEGVGFCLDETTPCDQTEGWCEERFAYNCVDGARAEKRCSLAQRCEVLANGDAACIVNAAQPASE